MEVGAAELGAVLVLTVGFRAMDTGVMGTGAMQSRSVVTMTAATGSVEVGTIGTEAMEIRVMSIGAVEGYILRRFS